VSAPPPGRILTLNRGSATLKAALYDVNPAVQPALSIKVDRIDSPDAQLIIKDKSGAVLFDSSQEKFDSSQRKSDSQGALQTVFDWLESHGFLANLLAAGHRLVHGGTQFQQPTCLTPEVVVDLEKLTPIDPDHLPAALAVIRFISQRLPNLSQIGCFDTAFHRDLPKVARMYALPRRYFDDGVMRFGFHGLSYEYILSELRKRDGHLAETRVVIAHLGNGASMVALRDGKSIDTSMGFTPLEGLVMGTRSGDVDPGALIYLLGQSKMSPKELDVCLNKRSGLLGVSGSSEDMRDLLEKSSRDEHAAEAVELFCYRARKYLGAYAAALGGLDVLAFTGGIGEKSAPVRRKICDNLEFLGIQLDLQRNQTNESVISSAASRVKVLVLETNEDLTIVRHVLRQIGRS
jgi:acetate kinase